MKSRPILMNSPEERRAYSKGYAAGTRANWPEHRPPLPTEPALAELLAAARSLRDKADTFQCGLDQDDPWVTELCAMIDEYDRANAKLTSWLTSLEPLP